MSRFKKKDHKLSTESTVRSLNLKFYDEQLIESMGTPEEIDTCNKLSQAIIDCKTKELRSQHVEKLNTYVYSVIESKGYDKKLYDNIRSVDPLYAQIYGIRHDRDYLEDDFFCPSIEKRHYHVILRLVPDEHKNYPVVKARTLLNLLGIKYRKKFDETIILNKAMETVGKFPTALLYLTHEDDSAIRAGKTIYSKSELITNMPESAYELIIKNLLEHIKPHRITYAEMNEICDRFYNAGLHGQSFNKLIEAYGRFNLYSQSKYQVIEKMYRDGIEKRLSENHELNRLVLYIQGASDMGKTCNIVPALERCGVSHPYIVRHSGNGNLDGLQPDHDALVFDDSFRLDNILTAADQYECSLYKRNKGNSYFFGNYLIILSNEKFEDWIDEVTGFHRDEYGYLSPSDQERYNAIINRFCVVKLIWRTSTRVGYDMLRLFKRGGEGSDKSIFIRGMFLDFMRIYIATINEYWDKKEEVIPCPDIAPSVSEFDIPKPIISDLPQFVKSEIDVSFRPASPVELSDMPFTDPCFIDDRGNLIPLDGGSDD